MRLRFVAIMIGVVSLLLLSACVTEVRSASGSRPKPIPSANAQSTKIELPDGPIAQPATSAAVLNSHVRVAVQPIGEVPFDGQTLPLLSHDGKFLATQVGPTPSWATILGEQGAPLASTRIERYELTAEGPRAIGEVDAPVGTLLGHRVSSRGFTVSVQEEAGRHEAGVDWLKGTLREVLLATEPIATRFQLDDEGVLALQMDSARRRLANNATAFTRHQAFASLQDGIVLPRHEGGLAQEPPGFLFFHPGAERMAIYVFATQDIVLLAPNSIAGAWHAKEDAWGIFLTTPEGLQYQAIGVDKRGIITVAGAARVLHEAYVPRSTNDPEHPFLLIGPGSTPTQLRLMWMSPVADAQ